MSKASQTSVEWLLTQLVNAGYINQNELTDKDSNLYFLCENALKINILQIKHGFHDGRTWNMSWNPDSYYEEVYENNGRYI